MNDLVIELTKMKRAMRPFVLFLYTMTLESDAQEVLEIGVRQAQSTRSILSAIHEKGSGSLTSIDLQDRTHRLENCKYLLPHWKTVVGDSHKQETLDKVKDKQYDILLIDGDHGEGVSMDWNMYSPLVKKGGYILFHDIINEDCYVPEFWRTLPHNNKIELPFGVAGMGIIQKT